ncbi:MAG: DUF2071 domain-containing protein [Candidatus Acidiferrum sp.]|jgi:uncharacterized protein YqjF (DUF2071 family)
MSKSAQNTAHRPWPLPAGPWVMAQSWHDLLFAHWPVPVQALRPLVPAGLEVDVFGGSAWLGVVPFRMSGVRLRATPALPWLSHFPELNVRTYVQREGKPGVWFFSLEAGNSVAVQIARFWFHLPYFYARMRTDRSDGWIRYASERASAGARAAVFRARYRPAGPPSPAPPGSLAYFLTERYCLYTVDAEGRLLRGEIHHPAWLLESAEAEIAENTVAQAAGISLPDSQALLHFAKRQDVIVWAAKRIT